MNPQLATYISQLSRHRVLVMGDVMLDRFVYGQVDRISPEAPIPVLHVQREAISLGGAGNVVRNIVSLGGHVDLIGVIGDDQYGYDLSQLVSQMPEVTSYLFTDKGRPTTLKIRYIANSQQLLRADQELAHPLSPAMEQQALLRVKSALHETKVIILSDYAKGVLSPTVVAEVIAQARAKGCRVLIDPKGRDFSRYQSAYLITPNRKELSEATGLPIKTVDDAETASRQLIANFHLDGVLAKLGSDGVCLVMNNEKALHFRTTTREVFDVSGAGDTVVATLALGIAGGLTPAAAAELANLAGSIVVGKVGTASITPEELERGIMLDQTLTRELKIAADSQIAEIAERWRSQGLKVGFTNGCFDLLHPGHISLLKQARAACDKLIVALNSDSSVKALKGESRPIQNEQSRSTVLASLSDVDCVVVFKEETPYELIKRIRPDVLIKGSDYTLDKVVGADLVNGWGGKVILASLIEGQSTTATIAKLHAVR